MEYDLSNKVIARLNESGSSVPRRSLDLGNINTPELGLLSPNRNEIAPRGQSREAALLAYSERLRNSYKQNEFGLKDGMVMLGEAFRSGQTISITCFCRAGQMCHADVVKIAIEKVAKAIDAREFNRAADHSAAQESNFRPSNPRTERAVNEMLSFSKTDLLLSKLDDTNGRNQSEHASYLNGQNQLLRDLYERGGTVKDGILVVPKDLQQLKSPLQITTQEYGIRRLEPSIGSERSREVVPQLLEYGKAIAGSGADRETEAKVFRWIYDALDGKHEFLEEAKEESRTESSVQRFERTLLEIAKVAEEMKGLEPSDHPIKYEGFDESYIQTNAHSLSEAFEDIADHENDLAPEQDLGEHIRSSVGFERVDLESTPLNLLAAEMSAEEFQHWAQVKLPALDDALENGIKPSITIKVLKARVEKAIQKGTETTALSPEDLRFASAYLEYQLKQPETRLRHFNERYRDYAQMLDRCQSREEVIDVSSRIRIENASAGMLFERNSQYQDSKSPPVLTSKELQMLFTEQSPRHYTSEMIVAKLNYAGNAVSRNAKTEALLKGEIAPTPEARKLVDSLESRMGRKYFDESLAATKHFLQSLKTPNEELRYKNSFDHRELYQRLPPAERDYVYQLATKQKEQLEAVQLTAQDPSKNGYEGFDTTRRDLKIEKLQETMKRELLELCDSNPDRELVGERTDRVLLNHLDSIGLVSANEDARKSLTLELGDILLAPETQRYNPPEIIPNRMKASSDGHSR